MTWGAETLGAAVHDARHDSQVIVRRVPLLSARRSSTPSASWNMLAMGAAIVTLEEGITAGAVAGTRRATGGAAVSTDDLWHFESNTKGPTSRLAAVGLAQPKCVNVSFTFRQRSAETSS